MFYIVIERYQHEQRCFIMIMIHFVQVGFMR